MNGLAGGVLFSETGDVKRGTPSLLMLSHDARYIDDSPFR
jgi:hypothetical protein